MAYISGFRHKPLRDGGNTVPPTYGGGHTDVGDGGVPSKEWGGGGQQSILVHMRTWTLDAIFALLQGVFLSVCVCVSTRIGSFFPNILCVFLKKCMYGILHGGSALLVPLHGGARTKFDYMGGAYGKPWHT